MYSLKVLIFQNRRLDIFLNALLLNHQQGYFQVDIKTGLSH
jgi:hypothetical protein